DLVLEHDVIPEGVPRQLADEAVVLVQVVARVREHEVRSNARLELLERVLHIGSRVREVSVAETEHVDRALGRVPEEQLRAPACLVRPLATRGEDDPLHGEAWVRPDEREDGAAAADLEVVRVGADREHATDGLTAREAEGEHHPTGDSAGSRPTRSHGARPESKSPSSHCLSLIVSIGPKNPSWVYAPTSPRGISL